MAKRSSARLIVIERQLLRLYQQHVVYCCKAVLLGYEDIGAAWETKGDRLWYGIQNLIVGAGNLSKTFWGTGDAQERARRYAERQPLRDSLSITDDSPLKRVAIRNDYEHMDERLETWWHTSSHHNVVGTMIGPRGAIGGPAFDESRDILRWLDPSTGDLIFWGNELNIPLIVEEVQRILPIAETESRKSHRENHQTRGGGG